MLWVLAKENDSGLVCSIFTQGSFSHKARNKSLGIGLLLITFEGFCRRIIFTTSNIHEIFVASKPRSAVSSVMAKRAARSP